MNEVRAQLSALDQPVDHVIWVPCDQVHPNDYNPNAVAKKEMQLLKKSIQSDGYTQPIVTVQDEDGKYCIVDGFHRYFIGSTDEEIKASIKGYLPIVVLEKDISDRMAATVRHNRARGKHSVVSMSSLVFKLLEAGKSEEEIANELGMEAEEVMRLKYITGYAKLYEKHEFSKAYETPEMAKHRIDYLKEHPDEYGLDYK
jgi:ParB-like chromosome segregation protein Spo0J